jgi:hypothetical protein
MSFVVDCSVTVPWYLEFSSAILNAEKRRRITAADRL